MHRTDALSRLKANMKFQHRLDAFADRMNLAVIEAIETTNDHAVSWSVNPSGTFADRQRANTVRGRAFWPIQISGDWVTIRRSRWEREEGFARAQNWLTDLVIVEAATPLAIHISEKVLGSVDTWKQVSVPGVEHPATEDLEALIEVSNAILLAHGFEAL